MLGDSKKIEDEMRLVRYFKKELLLSVLHEDAKNSPIEQK